MSTHADPKPLEYAADELALHRRIDAMAVEASQLSLTEAEKAERLAQQALALAENGGGEFPPYAKGVADSCDTLAAIHYDLSNYSLAFRYGARAYEYYDAMNAHKTAANTRRRMASCIKYLGEYSEALDLFSQALEHALQANDICEQGAIHNSVGIMYQHRQDHEQALYFFKRALDLFIIEEHQPGICQVKGNLGASLVHCGEHESALNYGREALALADELSELRSKTFALQLLGDVYFVKEEFAQARDFYGQSFELAQRIGHAMAERFAIAGLGKVFMVTNQPEEAIIFLQDALQKSTDQKNRDHQYQCVCLLAEAHERLGEWRIANSYLRRSLELHQAIFDDQNEARVANLQMLYKTRLAVEEAELQRQLRTQDQQYFERLSDLRNEFFNAATHDLKNPLTAIMLSTGLLRNKLRSMAPSLLQHLNSIEHQSKVMRELVEQILDIAKLETGRAISPHKLNFESFLYDATEQFADLAVESNVTLCCLPPDEVSTLEVDPIMFRRALTNLISNAIKYTPEGGTVMVAGIIDGEYASEIQVIDTGIGIDADDLPHIFENFYRCENGVQAASEGTGLGLSIAKTIVEQHNGEIIVYSTPGQGSTFSIQLSD